ncbi:MAG: glycosyltransferase family 2 protein [Gloeomargaritaceae cyanobacterium C42_A2020_066]|nr:glycosyltransferase family 2 protein [Gloeomargaritaceae cyanobacterium C42_A2020_066]
MASPLVSVLIPAYNAERYLAETLESVLAQTWRNLEIIVVNDGSRDNTLAVARRYESPRVRVVDQENRGQSASENVCLDLAQGDFIQYLDADDLLAPDKIERQLDLLGHEPSDWIATCAWARFYQTPSDALFIPQPLWQDLDPVAWLVSAWGGYMMHGATWMIPRQVSDRAGRWDEKLSLINDFDYFPRVVLASQGVRFCAAAKTYYRSGVSGSLSGSKSRQAWESAFNALSQGTANLLQREDSVRTRQACAAVFQRFIYEIYPEQPDLVQLAETKVAQWGGSDEQPRGGTFFQTLRPLVGWKLARRLQKMVYSRGYARLAWGWKLSEWLKKRRHIQQAS